MKLSSCSLWRSVIPQRKAAFAKLFGVILVVSLIPLFTYGTAESVEIHVKDKGHITVGSGEDISGKYLIYADDETFENEGSLLHWKFNSSDVQGQLERDQRYKVRVYGWRIPFLSWYRNIVEIEQAL